MVSIYSAYRGPGAFAGKLAESSYACETTCSPGTPRKCPRLCVIRGAWYRSAVAAIHASARSIRRPAAWRQPSLSPKPGKDPGWRALP